MSKMINKIVFGFCSFTLVLFASVASGDITNVLPQIQAIYGGAINHGLEVIGPVGVSNVARLFVSTEGSGNSIFYADLDHSQSNLFATNVFSWHVVPDFNAHANMGAVNDLAAHEDSGRLFVAHGSYGLLSCTTNAGSLVTNISSMGVNGSAQFFAVGIDDSALVTVAALNGSDVLYFGTLATDGIFTPGADSPINVNLNITICSDIRMEVNPTNHCVYLIDCNGTNGIRKSSAAITNLSAATTFSTIALPSAMASLSSKRLGFGPEGRLFVAAATAIAYSDDDGGNWTVVDLGTVGAIGSNVRTSSLTNQYSVLFGGAISTNKGVAGSWRKIGEIDSRSANAGGGAFDPLDEQILFYSSAQGMGCSTNLGTTLFEIDHGLEAVVVKDLEMNADRTLAWIASQSGLLRGTGTPMALQWRPDAIFPQNDAPCSSVAIDKADPSGNTVYAGCGKIYKTIDGGMGETNWTKMWGSNEGNTNGFANNGYFAALAANGQNVAAGFYSGTGAGGLLVSQDGGTNWIQSMSSNDVNDVLLMTNNSILIAVAYNATSGAGGIYSQSASSNIVRELTDNVGIRCFALDSTGGVYACGQAPDYAIKIYYKLLSASSWTEVTADGIPAQQRMVSQRGPVMTVGRDSSSNDLPIIVVENSLYCLTSGSSTWQTSSALTYPVGSLINVLYWDELMVGTSEGLYGQGLNTQAPRGDPGMVVLGNWYFWLAAMGYQMSGPFNFGVSAMPVAADFDGDGKADPTMVSASGGLWYIWFSGTGYQLSGGPWNFGVAGDPVAADFDGDRKADPAMVVNTLWYIWFSGAGYQLCGGPWNFGVEGYPVAADFDGDGKGDPCMVVGPLWYIWFSGAGYQLCGGPWNFGVEGIPVAGDFDADGKADPAMVVDSLWYIWFSGAGYQLCGGPWNFGVAGYPVAADFDGR